MRPDMEYADALERLCCGTPTPSHLPQALTASPMGQQSADLARWRALPMAAVLCLHERVEHEKRLWGAPYEHSAWSYPRRSTRTMLLSRRRPWYGSVVNRL